jgi:hypothetical protein
MSLVATVEFLAIPVHLNNYNPNNYLFVMNKSQKRDKCHGIIPAKLLG